MITNDDVKKLKTVFATKDDLKKLEVKFASKIDLQETKQELLDKIDERYSDIFNLVDGMAREIKDEREFRTVTSYQIEKLNEKVFGVDRT